MLYDADRILEMGFLRDLNKNFAVITLAVSVSLWLRFPTFAIILIWSSE